MRERLRKEILELVGLLRRATRAPAASSSWSRAPATASAETRRRSAGCARVMFAPDWRIENLPRLRDLVDQAADRRCASAMLGAEEGWVDDPRDAWWRQAAPLYLHTELVPDARARSASPALDAARSARRRRSPPRSPRSSTALGRRRSRCRARSSIELAQLALATGEPGRRRGSRAGSTRAGKLSPQAQRARARGRQGSRGAARRSPGRLARGRLERTCASEMAHDLERRRAGGAREARARCAPRSSQRATRAARRGRLDGEPRGDRARRRRRSSASSITTPRAQAGVRGAPRRSPQRLREHDASGGRAAFVGLVDAVDVERRVRRTSRRRPRYTDTTDDARARLPRVEPLHRPRRALDVHEDVGRRARVLERPAPAARSDGALDYYAERCPLLPQTLRFVIEQLQGREARSEHRALRDRDRVRLAGRGRLRERARARWRPISSTA